MTSAACCVAPTGCMCARQQQLPAASTGAHRTSPHLRPAVAAGCADHQHDGPKQQRQGGLGGRVVVAAVDAVHCSATKRTSHASSAWGCPGTLPPSSSIVAGNNNRCSQYASSSQASTIYTRASIQLLACVHNGVDHDAAHHRASHALQPNLECWQPRVDLPGSGGSRFVKESAGSVENCFDWPRCVQQRSS